jgi:hypothetical protein
VHTDKACSYNTRPFNTFTVDAGVLFWFSKGLYALCHNLFGRSWEVDIRRDVKEIGWLCIEWIQLAQDGDEPGGSGATELVITF